MIPMRLRPVMPVGGVFRYVTQLLPNAGEFMRVEPNPRWMLLFRDFGRMGKIQYVGGK